MTISMFSSAGLALCALAAGPGRLGDRPLAYFNEARESYRTAAFAAGTNTVIRSYSREDPFGPDYRLDIPVGPWRGVGPQAYDLKGFRNFRDIGGWTGLRTGRVFRGSELRWQDGFADGVDPETRTAIREQLKIVTELDLRGTKERDVFRKGKRTRAAPDALGLNTVNVPFSGYLGMFGKPDLVRDALKVFMSAANYPIYVHCAGGADRTGTVILLVEALCGVSEADMDVDYELTSFATIYGLRHRDETAVLKWKSLKDELRRRYPSADLNGSVYRYVTEGLGFSSAEVDVIRAQVALEPGELTYGNGYQRYIGYRTWTVEAPETGLYELRLAQVDPKWLPGKTIVRVDDRQAFFARGNYRTIGIPAKDGVYSIVRRLEKGTHEIDLLEQFFWPVGTGPKEFLGGRIDRKTGKVDAPRVKVTFRKAAADAVAFQFDDRDDMVFEQGERSVLKEYRADGSVIDHVVDTSRGGAHVLEVDGFGKWQYVVVDTKRGVGERCRCREEGVTVDAVDCTEGEGGPHRFRDNGTSKLVKSSVGTYRLTGPFGFKDSNKGEAKPDWFAYSLKVEHPQRTHVVKLTLPNDVRRAIPAMSHDPVTGNYNGWIVQAGMGPASGPTSEMKYYVWPNTNWIDVLVYCANGMKGDGLNREGAVLGMELVEYPEGLPRLEEPKCGWNPDRVCGWVGEQVDLGPFERTMPPLWDDGHFVPAACKGRGRWAYDWNALNCVWDRFGEVCGRIGHNWFCFPVYSYGMQLIQGRAAALVTPGTERYSEGNDAGAPKPVDLFDRDIMKLMLLNLGKYGVSFTADFMFNRFDAATIQPQWEEITGAPRRDTLLTASANGDPARFMSCTAFMNPAHPAVRERLVDLYDAIGERYGRYPAFGGVRTRFWRWWPGTFEGFFWSPNFGYEDWTVAEFGKDTGIVLPPVGTDEQAYARRRHELQTTYGAAWFGWRATKCLSLRERQKAALRRHAPQAKMVYVNDTTDPDALYRGSGIEREFFEHRADLGFTTGSVSAQHKEGGVEWNGIDVENFYRFNVRPGKGANPPLEEMKKLGRAKYPQGYCNIACTDAYPYELKAPALALADNALTRLTYGGSWVLPPEDDGLIAFTRVWRAIPTKDWTRVATKGGREAPVAVWQATDGDDTLVFAVNRTDLTRTFTLDFPSARSAMNQVTGAPQPLAARNSQLATSLPPYMPVYLKLAGCKGVVKSTVTFTKEELDKAERSYRFLAAMDAKARKMVEVQALKGPKVVLNAGTFGNEDLRFTWEELFNPIKEAYEEGNLFAVGEKIAAFDRDHAWWYERFGYPDGFAYPKYAKPAELPTPIPDFQVIGPFQTVALTNGQHNIDYYAGTYPPETEGYQPGKAYKGLYGWEVRWKPAHNTTTRVIDLEKELPECDVVAANDVGFLMTWIRAPKAVETRLHHCGDYFIELTLNGEKVVAKDGGPCFGYYKSVPVKLKAGWNCVLARSSPGCTHHWNFGLAIDAFEGMELSGVPPKE